MSEPRRQRRIDAFDVLHLVGLVLIVAGVAFIYWPAAPIALGVGLIALARWS